MQQTLSLIAGILFLLGFIPYIRAIWRDRKLPPEYPGKTQPSKASWLIWASLDTITIYGMYLEKSVNGQIVGAVFGAWLVVLLVMKYGRRGWSKLDAFCLLGAVAGISLMFLNPAWALLVSLITVFVGAFPTFRSTWKDPSGEDKLAWTIYWLSCLCAIFAVPKWTIEDAAQPITFLTIESIMMGLLFLRPSKRAQSVGS